MSVAPAAADVPLDTVALADWMRGQGFTVAASLTARSLTGGQSNPTFLLSDGQWQFVLRKKPPGPLLPSAHAEIGRAHV